jgi:hypothetical protein
VRAQFAAKSAPRLPIAAAAVVAAAAAAADADMLPALAAPVPHGQQLSQPIRAPAARFAHFLTCSLSLVLLRSSVGVPSADVIAQAKQDWAAPRQPPPSAPTCKQSPLKEMTQLQHPERTARYRYTRFHRVAEVIAFRSLILLLLTLDYGITAGQKTKVEIAGEVEQFDIFNASAVKNKHRTALGKLDTLAWRIAMQCGVPISEHTHEIVSMKVRSSSNNSNGNTLSLARTQTAALTVLAVRSCFCSSCTDPAHAAAQQGDLRPAQGQDSSQRRATRALVRARSCSRCRCVRGVLLC